MVYYNIMMKNNYYEILEISQTASGAEIKRSYYTLAKKYHPDINPKTANLFKNINAAYETLRNPIKRREYDNMLNGIETIEEETLRKYQEASDNLDAVIKDLEEELKQYQEEEDINEFDYYTDSQYYQDPVEEPLFTIIKDFKQYRLEKAIRAIWSRNFFVLCGGAILYLLAFVSILFNKVFRITKPNKIKTFKWKWYTRLQNLIFKNKLLGTTAWFIILTGLVIIKTIFNILYSFYWIFTRIIRYFLLPIAIILAVILRTMLTASMGR